MINAKLALLLILASVSTSHAESGILQFPSRLYQMDKIALRNAVYIHTGHPDEIAQVSGSNRVIVSASDAGGGVVTLVLSEPHTFLVGDKVLISDTNNGSYNGKYTVLGRPHRTRIQIAATWNETTTGLVREVDEEIIYSPLDGLPAVKCIARAGGHSGFTFVFADSFRLWPNTGFIMRNAGHMDTVTKEIVTDNILEQWGPRLIVSEQTTPSNARSSGYGSHHRANFHFTDKWHARMIRRCDYGVRASGGMPKAWATTLENQAFETTAITFEKYSTQTPNADVFYLGGVVTQAVKAKLCISFDGFPASSEEHTMRTMGERGWRGIVVGKLAGYAGNAAWEERIQRMYDRGWDISLHSWDHINFTTKDNPSHTADLWIKDNLSAKRWMAQKGWIRGNDFIAYTGARVVLHTQDGGNVAGTFFKMGRGEAWRKGYYQPEGWKTYEPHGPRGGGYSTIVPNDMLSLNHCATHSSKYDNWPGGTVQAGTICRKPNTVQIFKSLRTTTVEPDISASEDWEYLGDCNNVYELSSVPGVLENTVLHQGVANVYSHSIMNDPPDIHVTPEYWDVFMADVAAYVDAGLLDVVTWTDWYNEIYGINKDSTPTGLKGDLNNDGTVDLLDFAIMAENWLVGTEP